MSPSVIGSPNASGQNMLVSFNFLTQVPIEEFVVQEHSKASKLSARLKSNASMKIERELERKIKDREQRARRLRGGEHAGEEQQAECAELVEGEGGGEGCKE